MFLNNIRHALRGIKDILVWEKSFRVMMLAAIFVIAGMFYFPTTHIEKAVLFLAIFAVLGLELINSVIERIMDFIHEEHHTDISDIKDVMASIVFVASIGAAIVG